MGEPTRGWTRLGILGAMHEEVAGLAAHLEGERVHEAGGRRYREGTLFGRPVVLAFSRWGKVAAAATAARMLAAHGVDALLFTGVAGGVDPSLRVGDVVVADRLFQHDMDASPLYPPLEVPLLGVSAFEADAALSAGVEAAARAFLASGQLDPEARAAFGLHAPRVVRGDVASGDRFFASAEALAGLRARVPSAACVEMEGAAVAQVCFELGVPFAVVRTISDNANEEAATDFMRFVKSVAAIYSQRIVKRLGT